MPPPACVPANPAVPIARWEASVRGTGERPINWLLIVKVIGLIAVTCVCYWPALNGSFLWDDGVLITENPLLKSFAGLRDIWCSTKPYDFFPLTYTTFWLEWHLWGKDPTGYHLVNVVLHLSSAFLLWKLLLEMRLPGAWLGAFLFAVHPLNVASVAWIAERKNVLSMVFYLACLFSYVRSENVLDERGQRRWYLLALGFFALAALSKSSVVMLPFVLLLLGWWRRGTVTWAEAVRDVPFFAISCGGSVATMWFQYHRSMSPEFYEAGRLPWLTRLLMSGHSAWFYLGKAFFPVRLSMLYPRWQLGFSSSSDYFPLLAWTALLLAAWVGRRWWGWGPLAVLAYFTVMLVPVSGLFRMSFFTYSYVSDHLVYLSLLGIIVGVSSALGAWCESRRPYSFAALPTAALIAGSLCVACPFRAQQFSSQEQLWESTRLVVPENFAVYDNLGVAAQQQGLLPKAETYFRTAARLEPRSLSSLSCLANVLRKEGKWPQSAAIYECILQTEPNAECFNNLGVVFLEMGDTDRARVALNRALQMEPAMRSASFNLYKTELAGQRFSEAAAALRGLLRYHGKDAEAMTALARLNLNGGGTMTGTGDFGP